MTWKLTTRLEDFVDALIKEAGIGPTDTPSIMWSTGGVVEAPGQLPQSLPAHYALGWVDRQNLSGFQTIPSARFGEMVFHPSPADFASARRLIDYDGSDIVVR